MDNNTRFYQSKWPKVLFIFKSASTITYSFLIIGLPPALTFIVPEYHIPPTPLCSWGVDVIARREICLCFSLYKSKINKIRGCVTHNLRDSPQPSPSRLNKKPFYHLKNKAEQPNQTSIRRQSPLWLISCQISNLHSTIRHTHHPTKASS